MYHWPWRPSFLFQAPVAMVLSVCIESQGKDNGEASVAARRIRVYSHSDVEGLDYAPVSGDLTALPLCTPYIVVRGVVSWLEHVSLRDFRQCYCNSISHGWVSLCNLASSQCLFQGEHSTHLLLAFHFNHHPIIKKSRSLEEQYPLIPRSVNCPTPFADAHWQWSWHLA